MMKEVCINMSDFEHMFLVITQSHTMHVTHSGDVTAESVLIALICTRIVTVIFRYFIFSSRVVSLL
jgi:hypothetical protein